MAVKPDLPPLPIDTKDPCPPIDVPASGAATIETITELAIAYQGAAIDCRAEIKRLIDFYESEVKAVYEAL